jgi:hypothetical protein
MWTYLFTWTTAGKFLAGTKLGTQVRVQTCAQTLKYSVKNKVMNPPCFLLMSIYCDHFSGSFPCERETMLSI